MAKGCAAIIGDDPLAPELTASYRTPRLAALAARRYAKLGEIITIIGPRGGFTRWRAVGTEPHLTVWRIYGRA